MTSSSLLLARSSERALFCLGSSRYLRNRRKRVRFLLLALMTDSAPLSRRWTVIGSGLLCCALALVVIYTTRSAFFSPLAVVVVAAIGLAAVLLQLRARGGAGKGIHPPTWLNIVGTLLALGAAFADLLHLSWQIAQILALAAVGVFGISGAIILHAVRKQHTASK